MEIAHSGGGKVSQPGLHYLAVRGPLGDVWQMT